MMICRLSVFNNSGISAVADFVRLVTYTSLTFMGLCIVNMFQYISNKMQIYTVYLYLETALHVSGGTSTHYQERIQLYLQHLVFVTPLLLPAAIMQLEQEFQHLHYSGR